MISRFSLFPMASLLMFVSNCLGSKDGIRYQVANTSVMRDPQTGLNFGMFVKHESKYLSVSTVSVVSVKNSNICYKACVGRYQCFSINLEVKQNGEELRCELLSTDMFNASQSFTNATNFVHYSLQSSCYPMPCKNGATCLPFYNNNTHSCRCISPYYGSACEKRKDCLTRTIEEMEKNGIYNVAGLNGTLLQAYRDVTKDYNWTLIARFSNKDDNNWMQSGGSWWYDTITAQGSTLDPFINQDMLSPGFWSIQGREIKLTRSNDRCHTPLLQTLSNCLGFRTFRSMISSYGNFRTTTWENDNCLARCHVSYSGDYSSVIGFSQANCNGTLQDSQKIGFWCGGGGGNLDGALMMIGGGGEGCDRADHGIAVTEVNSPKFKSGCDFGDDSECSTKTGYAINLWIRE